MQKKHAIELNQAPIAWALDEGRMSFFGIPAVTFWLNPSLLRMLQPLREEVGDELYRLMIAYQASLGTEEDYHQMVTQLGRNFEEGFLAWGAAVSAAGWGHFEMIEFNQDAKTAIVRVTNPWELQMFESQADAEGWGCPFLLGKIIGIFSHAMGETCWADEKNIIMAQTESLVELHIYASELTIEQELGKLRSLRRSSREKRLQEEIEQRMKVEAELRASEQQFRNLATNFSAISGIEFFSKVTSHLAKTLDVDYVMIGELVEGNDRISVVAGYAKGKPMALPFIYDLADTPCENIIKQSFCFYPSDVQIQFPKDQLLVEMGVDSYFGTPLFNTDGQVLGLIAVLDSKPAENSETIESIIRIFSSRVSSEMQRKRSEEKLKKSEYQYRSLFESSSDAIMLLGEASFIDCNKSTLDMFGYASVEEFSKYHPADFSPPVQPCGTDSRTLVDQHIATAFELGKHQFEWMHRRVNGELFPTEVWLTAMKLDGKQLLQANVRDLSLRKKAEASLRKLSSAIEQAGESIIITDRSGVIEYINPAFEKITGYSADEAIGQTPRLLKSGNQDASFYQSMWKTITSGIVWHGKVIDKRKDGSFFPAMLTISPIMDESGEITHFVGLQSDLTEQESLEQQFHQAQKMEAIGTLVGGIAHDFNNMLAGMTGNIYIAKLSAKDMPDVQARLDNIELISHRAADMIQQLLTFARKDRVSIKQIPFTSFIKETCKLLRPSVSENINMQVEACSDALQIRGDATLLHQVLMNLVNNARDAVESVDDPCITVRLESFQADDAFVHHRAQFKAGAFAHVSVTDNGCGIPKNQIKHLVEPFFTTKEQGKGTGLGLAMVFGAVKTHDGFVEVDTILGRGTTFHIYIPLLESEGMVAAPAQARQKEEMGYGELILLVDDEACIVETGKEVLEALGYRVLIARNGQQAVDAFSAHAEEIALVILDVVMPLMSGGKAAQLIRQQSPNVKIIFATGYDKNTQTELSDEVVLGKPFSIVKMSRLIRQQLGISQI